MWFSTQLFEIGTSPSSTKPVSSFQRLRLSSLLELNKEVLRERALRSYM